MDFYGLLFRFREELLRKFPGESRRRWYDPEDAFSDVTLEAYEEAVKGDLKGPPEKDNWVEFLRLRMRRKIWLHRRRDERNLTGGEGQDELLQVKDGDTNDPTRRSETMDELELLVPQVKKMLSPKQQAVFFAKAQDLVSEDAARQAGTSPGAMRVHAQRAEKKLRERLEPSRVA